ncbi:MAG: cell division protein SepF [Lachnospiraceae bacterium]|nr:cell division protein SepF [Lachnospiraceae bacterium]
MGVIDKFLDVMKLGDDDYDDDYDDYDDDYDDYDDEKPEKKSIFKRKRDDDYDDDYEEEPVKSKTSKVTPMRTPRRVNGMEVCVIKPTVFEDSREITETLLSNRTVLLNFEGLDVEIAQRIIDFISGSCFAIEGNLQKVTNYIFLVTPRSVEISGDLQEIISGSLDVPSVYSSHNGPL